MLNEKRKQFECLICIRKVTASSHGRAATHDMRHDSTTGLTTHYRKNVAKIITRRASNIVRCVRRMYTLNNLIGSLSSNDLKLKYKTKLTHDTQ